MNTEEDPVLSRCPLLNRNTGSSCGEDQGILGQPPQTFEANTR